MVNIYFNDVIKEFVMNLDTVNSEADATEWMKVTKNADNEIVVNFNSEMQDHPLFNTGTIDVAGIGVPKTRVVAPADSFIAIANMETGEMYVHDDNVMDSVHGLFDSLKDVNFLIDNGPNNYRFGSIDYFGYENSTQEWVKPYYTFTLSIFAMKKPNMVNYDKVIELNDRVNEVKFAATDGNNNGIEFYLDDGDKLMNKEFMPLDKVLYNRLRLKQGADDEYLPTYAPNIKVSAPANKWIYIRNRSTGKAHNTFLSSIDNLHLYITGIYGTPTAQTGLGDLRYMTIHDKVTKYATDFSDFQNIYTVSAEDQVPLEHIARTIILEGDEEVAWAQSNGLNDGTGYRYMTQDDEDLSFIKNETRSVVVDGKKFYYPIISVRAPEGKTIRILGSRDFQVDPITKMQTVEPLYVDTGLEFIDDLITYILNGDETRPKGYKGIGFISRENNNQFQWMADYLGNDTLFKVVASSAALIGDQVNFMNIYDPLFFEPNLVRPNLDTIELPFEPSNDRLNQAIFLMRDDYLTNEGNIVSGNLNNEAFVKLLSKLLTKESDDNNEMQFSTFENVEPYISDGRANTPRPMPKNLVIVKEEFKGEMNREIRRLTDEHSNVVEKDVYLHLNSTLHLIYDFPGQSKREMLIEIREDRDEITFAFDPNGPIDQTIRISETATYYNNRNHHIVKLKNQLNEMDGNADVIRLTLDGRTIVDPTNTDNTIPYIPIVKLDYETQRDLHLKFYDSNDVAVIGQGPTDDFENFKSYLDNAKVEYLIDRDILASYDTNLNVDKKEGENLEFGRNYVVLDMSDAKPDANNDDVAEDWDFYRTDGTYTKGYFKVEFVPILNEVIKCYYQPGQRILKSNISDKIYYRDSIRGYISLINGDQYLNKSMQYFIEKDVNYMIREIVDDGNGGKKLNIKYEPRRYRLYLDFVPAPVEFNYDIDQKIYDNNIFITNFSLTELHKNKLFLKFSADSTKDDMYKIYLSDNILMKGISADGKVTVTYQTLIDEIMYNFNYYYGDTVYDSEVYIGAIVQEETKDDGTIRRISIKPEFAELQKIIISKDGSTSGADAVVINLTVYMDKNHETPGKLLHDTLNRHYSTGNYPIKVIQEEREGLKLYNMNRLDSRNFLSFNSVYTLYLGLNDTKRVIVRERIVDDIVDFNISDDVNTDQSKVVSKYDDLLRIPLLRKMDVRKEIGGDVTTIDPAHNLTLEALYDAEFNLVNNYLLTKEFILAQLGVTNWEYVFIENNRRFNQDEGTYDSADADFVIGIGLLKLTFTTIINKILAVHYDDEDPNLRLQVDKLSIGKRVYYKDSLLNDYVSLINDPNSTFNKELEYFVEATIDNVTYRLRLDFRPYPMIYSKIEGKFDMGYMIKLDSTLSTAFDTNVTLEFSADNTTNDMHQILMSKSLLLSNVDNYGNILLSHTTVKNLIEKSMKDLYGKSWYDREMYIFNIIENGTYQLQASNGILIQISPFEYNFNQTLEIDLDLGTVTFVDQLPDEVWDFSVKSYGEFISGIYQPNDFGTGQTSVTLHPEAFASSAVLFDERNPNYNVKDVFLGTFDGMDKFKTVACGNVDPTSLVNLVNRIYLPNYQGTLPNKDDVDTEPVPIEPTYIFNPVSMEASTTNDGIYHNKKLAKGFNLSGQVRDLYGRDYVTASLPTGWSSETNGDDNYKSAYLNPIVHKMLSASLFTKFNNTVFVSYKDGKGLNANIGDNDTRYTSLEQGIKKRDLIMATLKAELDADNTNLYDSRLFKLYNALGKYEMDLDRNLQLVRSMDDANLNNPTVYDLEDFTINMLVKFKGSVSGSSTGMDVAEDDAADKDEGLNSGYSNNEAQSKVLARLVNQFFPESNAYVDDVEDDTKARIKYETIVKFQFINKKLTDDETVRKDIFGLPK